MYYLFKRILRLFGRKIYRKVFPILMIFILFYECKANGITLEDIIPNESQEIIKEFVDTTISSVDFDLTKEVDVIGSEQLTEVEFVRAVDGDTLIVNMHGEETKVRLIGIDTPESVHPDESRNSEDGVTASEYTKSILENTKFLFLEFDEEQNDVYGRTLAYVWFSEDMNNIENMLNARLIIDGYAVPKAYPPNTKYKDIFENLIN